MSPARSALHLLRPAAGGRGPVRLAIAAAALSLACRDPGPEPVASIGVDPPAASIVVGTSQQFTAAPRDGGGNPLAGRVVTWTVDAPGVATVAAGLVTAVAPGTVRVTATSERASGSATLTVRPVPVASVELSPATGILVVGRGLQLRATARDAAGNTLGGRAVEWSTSAPALATVDAGGRVTGVARGELTVTATIDGQRADAPVRVFDAAEVPTITGVSPATLVPGAVGELTGTNFDPLPARNAVAVRGVAARVLIATATRLLFEVPCVRSGTASVRVTREGYPADSAERAVAVPQRTIAVGQSLVLGLGSACNELAPVGGAARFLVVAYGVATSPNTLVDFELASSPAIASTVRAAAAPTRTATVVADGRDATGDAARDAAHFAMLERDRALYARLRAAGTASRRPAGAGARLVAVPAVGDMRRLFFTYSVGCNDTTRAVRARAVYAGTRAVVWEDSANALQSSADAALAGYYQRLGRLFDEEQYEVVRANFGDPLRRDALTDGDGRVHMVFTQHVNALGGVAAFVTSCDQFTGPGAAGSNVGEFFYGSVPTRAGSGPTDVSYPDGWFGFMARTVVHEVKHVASTAARLANFSFSLEQGWLEEATARHAEEIWVRGAIHRVPWKGNTGFGAAAANGLYCDFHLADAACVDVDPVHRPGFGMQRHFNELRPKLLEPWNWSPFGDGTEQSGSVFYQTGWSLVRYTIDRYGTSDAAFLRALTNAIATGMANLTAVAGASTDQLLGNWGVALFADDYPGLSAPSRDIDFPTWNLRDIYLGLSRDPLWATRFRTPFPVEPVQLTFGGFAAARPGLRGGAHAYFELSGTMREAQLLELRAPGGGPASPNVRLAIARLQ